MSGRVRLKKIDLQRAGQLAQAGCRVTFHPDGAITVEAVDAGAGNTVDNSVAAWRRKSDARKTKFGAGNA